MGTEKNFILAINREYGTNGRAIALEAAKRLNVKILDKSYLDLIRSNFNLSIEEIEKVKASKTGWWEDVCRFYSLYDMSRRGGYSAMHEEATTSREVYHAETQVLRDFAEHESCVIVGRTACHIFREDPTAIRVFLTASLPYRINHIMNKYKVSKEEAQKAIEKNDKARETYSNTFSGKTRYDLRDYDLTVRIDELTFEQSVLMLVNLVKFHKQAWEEKEDKKIEFQWG